MNIPVRFVFLSIAAAVVLACGGGPGESSFGAGPDTYDAYALNISGVTTVDVKVDGRYAFNGVAFGDRMGPLRMSLTTPAPVAVHGHNEVAPLWTGTLGGSLDWGIVVFGSPLAPRACTIDATGVDGEAKLYVVAGDWTTSAKFDVYVTAPGGALGQASQSNLTFSTSGGVTLPLTAKLTPGQTYQVRLCQPGTKTVVQDLGVIPSLGTTIGAKWTYVLATTQEGGAATTKLFALPPFIR